MGDTGSERSNASQLPPRCPCGFWGSSETMNLCSKCFGDVQKKQPEDDCNAKSHPNTNRDQSPAFDHETSSSNSQSSSSDPVVPDMPSSEAVPAPNPSPPEESSSTDSTHSILHTPTKRTCDSDCGSESDVSPEKKACLGEGLSEGEGSRGGSKQKRRRRCHRCHIKLELVQQELGSCRCGYVFCMLHRLPEQHDCMFDHLGRGREEAVLKMVKLDRKVGRSCQRIGEECS
ncbi:AN1-type zinc finger protein 3 homolog [Alosa pseudoharengus]|uniref:AN1-type zinc finger protein 3-like n=1 Tax=Alosa sapidissima TaxID=34773 RepID=UPI001C0824AB|nr:AN1-type zinc finger protein 3-like [Alosa sapidissima]